MQGCVGWQAKIIVRVNPLTLSLIDSVVHRSAQLYYNDIRNYIPELQPDLDPWVNHQNNSFRAGPSKNCADLPVPGGLTWLRIEENAELVGSALALRSPPNMKRGTSPPPREVFFSPLLI